MYVCMYYYWMYINYTRVDARLGRACHAQAPRQPHIQPQSTTPGALESVEAREVISVRGKRELQNCTAIISCYQLLAVIALIEV